MVAIEDTIIEEENKNTFKDNRAPKCARCRNHGIVNSLKGHKHFCKWKNCSCPRCQVVVERQRITASRVASLRQQRKISESVHKKVGNLLKFHESNQRVPDGSLINLDNVKYLGQMKQYGSLDSDNETERANSSGTPASMSPPASPPSSITSSYAGDCEPRSTYCADPGCYECWKISKYMLKTNINRLRVLFPMAPTELLESALSRAKGDFDEALQDLKYMEKTKPIVVFRDVRPCTDPSCKECQANSNKDIYRRSPIPFQPSTMLNRKRGYGYDPISIYEPLSKRSELPRQQRLVGDEPMLERDRVSPPMLKKSQILMPPVLIKYCVECSSQISIDDKFCGKCGFKQCLKTEQIV